MPDHSRVRPEAGILNMTKTISNSYSTTYTLTDQYTTVLNTGTVSVSSGAAIYGPSSPSISWTVTNSGTLLSSAPFASGIKLLGTGANVTNNAGGIINAGSLGYAINIRNTGGTVVNYGAIGGTVDAYGVVLNGAGTVTNTGPSATIAAKTRAIYLNTGGAVTNGASATISGGYDGVWGRQGVSTLTNAGTIRGGTRSGIRLVSGAIVTNQAAAVITSTGVGADFTDTFFNGGATLTNYGTITGGSGQDAVKFRFGTLLNQGTIGAATAHYGVVFSAATASGTIINTGSSARISAGTRGIYLNDGGVVTNGSGAVISGGSIGIWARQAAATLTNAGSIHGGTGAGIQLVSGATVTNQAGGVISSGSGRGAYFTTTDIGLTGGATLINYGTIAGGSGQFAVVFRSGFANLLVDEPGAVFTGNVDGGNPLGGVSISTLELASAASAGTLSGLGTNYVDFAQVTIDAGATWDWTGNNTVALGVSLTDRGTLEAGALVNQYAIFDNASLTASELSGYGTVFVGSDSMLSLTGAVDPQSTIAMTGTGDVIDLGGLGNFTGTITGFGSTGIIDVKGIGLAKSAVKPVGNPQELQLFASTDGSGTPLFTFPNIASITGGEGVVLPNIKLVDDGHGGTVVACYLRGTRIRTDRGERPIECLAIGDLVVTQSGALAPVRWIGWRRYVLAQTEGHAAVLPVLIRAGAIADGLPRRALYVSPEHALYLDGLLVPARHLVNGVSIERQRGREVVEYFHLELARHDIVFAEGLPSESFVDCDSRTLFDNAHTCTGGGAPPWTFCAPRVEDGAALQAIRRRIDARAGIADDAAPGRLIGNLERLEGTCLEGWAQDAATPERPVQLDIIADGAIVARVLANRHRDDLAAAGLGSGRHAFRVPLTGGARRIEARRSGDGALLGVLHPG